MTRQLSLLSAVASFMILSSCSHAPVKSEAPDDAIVVNHFTDEEELSFVERVIAQAPARAVAELTLDFYRGLSNEGKEVFLKSGSGFLGASEKLTAKELALQLEAKSTSQFFKEFYSAHPKYFNEAANKTVDQIITAEAAGRREMQEHSNISSGRGMASPNARLRATVIRLKNMRHRVAAKVVHAYNVAGVEIADPVTCDKSEGLSEKAGKNEELMFEEIGTAMDHLPAQTKNCAEKVVTAVAARFIALNLKVPAYEALARLAENCHIPSPSVVTPQRIREVEAVYPDASKIPENGTGVCKL